VTLRIPPAAGREIHDHLLAAYPEEGCGVLIGRESDGAREVERVVRCENRRPDGRGNRYLIAPEQFLAADCEARAAGLEVLGLFHSHPDHPAQPSASDLEHAWPYYSYLIVSVSGGAVAGQRCWRLRDDRSKFEAERVETGPAAGAAGV